MMVVKTRRKLNFKNTLFTNIIKTIRRKNRSRINTSACICGSRIVKTSIKITVIGILEVTNFTYFISISFTTNNTKLRIIKTTRTIGTTSILSFDIIKIFVSLSYKTTANFNIFRFGITNKIANKTLKHRNMFKNNSTKSDFIGRTNTTAKSIIITSKNSTGKFSSLNRRSSTISS